MSNGYDYLAKKDVDKTSVELIVELNALRKTNSRLKEVIARLERLDMFKKQSSNDAFEASEAQRELVESLMDEIKGHQAEREIYSEELDVQVEELRAANEELLKATELLTASEERFRTLADNTPNLAWMSKPDGSIFWFNKQFYDYTGSTLEEMHGWGWLKLHKPDCVQKVKQRWRSSIEAGREYENTALLRGKDGNYRWFLTRVIPVRDELGNVEIWLGTDTDITERKRAEEALNEAKQQAELYVDLMGHDINNLNQSAMGYLELALEALETEKRLKLDDKVLIERPMRAMENSSILINNVRKLQKLMTDGVKPKPISLNKIFRELESMSFDSDDRDILINILHVPDIMVEANELLKDVFLNLISNAIKHSDEEKPLIVNVKVEPVNENGQKYYRCIVEDNGPGIPDELKSKLFHRFQRGATKAHGKGLGLYLVRALVDGYGGNVWAEDRVQGDYKQGSRFVVMLPAVEK